MHAFELRFVVSWHAEAGVLCFFTHRQADCRGQMGEIFSAFCVASLDTLPAAAAASRAAFCVAARADARTVGPSRAPLRD